VRRPTAVAGLGAFFGIAFVLYCGAAQAPSDPGSLEQRVQKIMARPEFRHSRFGLKFVDADTGEVVYELNSAQLFVPGSTTKLLTEGTLLELLGADYRFHTKIYRTGPIEKDGTLRGDLVLVASGDPDLSNRIQPDGTLAFEDEDHSYGGTDCKGLPGDPLLMTREFAKQISAKGVKRISGKVLVDTSLFPEGYHELATDVVVSPIIVNDNVIDVLVSPGATENAPVQLKIMPKTTYVTILNQAKTGKVGSKDSLNHEDEKLNPDGTRSATLTGNLALDSKPTMHSYRVLEPSRFAATVLMEALKDEGVAASLAKPSDSIDFKSLSASYSAENLVAEHVSPPLKEDVRITLKVSQNLHASEAPYLLGALVNHNNAIRPVSMPRMPSLLKPDWI
jgi:PBP4 family serine-type D-alanyl-D-alanine carboxypeptidase